ncbi:MAG: nitronate monooxygenase [Chloroflexi bacterium]|nr:nitronate monooxygenase [Chloroflexota bacterium]
MELPKIIQGGMGVAISNYRLAKRVSQLEQLGVVSGTGLAMVLIGRLMEGDADGDMRRALSHFPFSEPVERIMDEYFIDGGMPPDMPYKRPPMWTMRPSKELLELTVIANFVEVFLAKEGHNNPVGINLLEKVQMPNMASLYGAMLAGVDFVIMGAGVPLQVPGILDKLAQHEAVSYRLDVLEAGEEEYALHFAPEQVFPGVGALLGTIKRPNFLPIISSVVLAQALIKRGSGSIEGFVIEGPTAGGHNAPPRGPLQLNDAGEPIYGEKDVVDLDKMRKLGYPFWLAGGYGTPEKYREALAEGAAGIQVGTAFAYCDESGMEPKLRQTILNKVLENQIRVRTDPVASPTGFPFKVVLMEGTLSESEVYAARERICDIGFLRHAYRTAEGKLNFRCPAEPVDTYLKKGGHEEDTVGRTCLCNNLGATAGFPQRRKDGYLEPVMVTSGDDLVHLGVFLKDGKTHYSARDVIEYLTGEPVNAP